MPRALSMFHEILERFQHSFGMLGYQPLPAKLESMAELVYESMSASTRCYHSVQHALDVADDADAIETLAALYHDLVYYQVDNGVTPRIWRRLERWFCCENDVFVLHAGVLQQMPDIALVMQVFDQDPQQPLTLGPGLNELLSACIAAEELKTVLSTNELLDVLACIEATIPFRGPDKDGHSCFEQLAGRLMDTPLADSDATAVMAAIKRAVRVANRDVESFGFDDPGHFLYYTWKVIPELNPALQNAKLYTIRDYRTALQGMEGFIQNLDPRVIFHSFRGYPEQATLNELYEKARHNLHIAGAYLRIKLFAIALLEALAEITGGDIALVFFMGDIERRGEDVPRMEDYLPTDSPDAFAAAADTAVQRLLEEGRTGESFYDMKSSPIAAYLYRNLGIDAVNTSLHRAREMFAGELSPQAFLECQQTDMVVALANACAYTAVTRSEALRAFARRLSQV